MQTPLGLAIKTCKSLPKDVHHDGSPVNTPHGSCFRVESILPIRFA